MDHFDNDEDGTPILRLMVLWNLPKFIKELHNRPNPKGEGKNPAFKYQRFVELDWDFKSAQNGYKFTISGNPEFTSELIDFIARHSRTEMLTKISDTEFKTDIKGQQFATFVLSLMKSHGFVKKYYKQISDNWAAFQYISPVHDVRTEEAPFLSNNSGAQLQIKLNAAAGNQPEKASDAIKQAILKNEGFGCKPKTWYRSDWRKHLEVTVNQEAGIAFVAGLNRPEAVIKAQRFFNSHHQIHTLRLAHQSMAEKGTSDFVPSF